MDFGFDEADDFANDLEALLEIGNLFPFSNFSLLGTLRYQILTFFILIQEFTYF